MGTLAMGSEMGVRSFLRSSWTVTTDAHFA